jgi:SAM-dependent methyltransferase
LAGLSERFAYQIASAESLPFDDAVFDMVTCQTLLMHVRAPERVLAEMVRVTRPGGLVVAAEASNVADPLVDSIALGDPPDVTASLLRFNLVCQRGVKSLGEGDHLIGESLPWLFRRAALEQVEVRVNDRGWTLVPPYDSQFERAQIEEAQDAAERELGLWDEETTRRYFLGGGGTEVEFAAGWTAALTQRRRVMEAIRGRSFSRAGGGFFYLVWGRRPEEAGG